MEEDTMWKAMIKRGNQEFHEGIFSLLYLATLRRKKICFSRVRFLVLGYMMASSFKGKHVFGSVIL
jgi:hypothetical protein